MMMRATAACTCGQCGKFKRDCEKKQSKNLHAVATSSPPERGHRSECACRRAHCVNRVCAVSPRTDKHTSEHTWTKPLLNSYSPAAQTTAKASAWSALIAASMYAIFLWMWGMMSSSGTRCRIRVVRSQVAHCLHCGRGVRKREGASIRSG